MAVAESEVREILRNPLDHDGWTIQGLGMLRLHLNTDRSQRLHIWDPSQAFDTRLSLHDHPWDILSSTVYFGRMGNVRYEIADEGDVPVQVSEVVCGVGGYLRGDTREGYARVIGEREEYLPGESYSMQAEEFHTSYPDTGTVTVIEKGFRDNRSIATLAWTGGGEWSYDGEFARPATVEEIQHFTGLVAVHS